MCIRDKYNNSGNSKNNNNYNATYVTYFKLRNRTLNEKKSRNLKKEEKNQCEFGKYLQCNVYPHFPKQTRYKYLYLNRTNVQMNVAFVATTAAKNFKCCRIIYKRKIVMHKKCNVADMNNEVKKNLLPPSTTQKKWCNIFLFFKQQKV